MVMECTHFRPNRHPIPHEKHEHPLKPRCFFVFRFFALRMFAETEVANVET